MRMFPTLLLLACSALSAAAAARQDRVADRNEIEANERAWSRAFVTGDASAPERFIAEDYTGVGSDGAIYTKRDEISNMHGPAHTTRATVDSVQVTFFGDIAVSRTREHGTGPAPELRPLTSISTDVWAKRDGRWQAVEGMYADLGFPVAAQWTADEASIRALRAANDNALASNNPETAPELYAANGLLVRPDGSTANGREELKQSFAARLREADAPALIRNPWKIAVAEDGTNAIESGRWAGVQKGRVVGGDYAAQWVRTAAGWKVLSELDVRLYGAGPNEAR